MTITNVVQAPALNQSVPYDILKDFVPLTLVANAPSLFVTTNPAITSLKQYVAMGSSATSKLAYGSYGAGTTSHIYAEVFNKRNKVQAVHVPYKGAAPLINDMLGGQVDVAFIDLATALPFIKAGRVKAFAIVGDHRSPQLPDVPTFSEQQFSGLDVVGWYGMFAPAGTPQAVAEKIRFSIDKVVRSPEGKKAITAMGLEPSAGPRTDFSARLLADLVNWRRIILEGGVKLD
jgi:tripartite-type tricarboxylate transporter receptor subunit TctC